MILYQIGRALYTHPTSLIYIKSWLIFRHPSPHRDYISKINVCGEGGAGMALLIFFYEIPISLHTTILYVAMKDI